MSKAQDLLSRIQENPALTEAEEPSSKLDLENVGDPFRTGMFRSIPFERVSDERRAELIAQQKKFQRIDNDLLQQEIKFYQMAFGVSYEIARHSALKFTAKEFHAGVMSKGNAADIQAAREMMVGRMASGAFRPLTIDQMASTVEQQEEINDLVRAMIKIIDRKFKRPGVLLFVYFLKRMRAEEALTFILPNNDLIDQWMDEIETEGGNPESAYLMWAKMQEVEGHKGLKNMHFAMLRELQKQLPSLKGEDI